MEISMKTSDFYYDLPEELIAQTPIEPRDASRLLVLDKSTGEVAHRHFRDLIEYLNKGDCLILNNTRVIPARIFGVKQDTGAVVEFLLLKQTENKAWECLCKASLRAGLTRSERTATG
jgi:S-adenosylmethionine:tRNA ribosyltransferase-isomerase